MTNNIETRIRVGKIMRDKYTSQSEIKQLKQNSQNAIIRTYKQINQQLNIQKYKQ